jgi:hypothetical protein
MRTMTSSARTAGTANQRRSGAPTAAGSPEAVVGDGGEAAGADVGVRVVGRSAVCEGAGEGDCATAVSLAGSVVVVGRAEPSGVGGAVGDGADRDVGVVPGGSVGAAWVGVAVGCLAVAVGGAVVAVGAGVVGVVGVVGVAEAGGWGVLVGGSAVGEAGGCGVLVGGSAVGEAGGCGVLVGGLAVAVAPPGVREGTVWRRGSWPGAAHPTRGREARRMAAVRRSGNGK